MECVFQLDEDMKISTTLNLRLQVWPWLCLLVLAVGCGSGSEEPKTANGRLNIITTTGMIADAAKNVAGDHADVTALMGPGVDPHLYKATQGDLTKLNGADIIFYNGLHLEGKMVEALEKLSHRKKVFPVSDGIDTSLLRRPAEFKGAYDPHLWFDAKLWSDAVRYIEKKLVEADSAHAADYHRNAAAYLAHLDSLDQWVRTQIAAIPQERRVLVTAHDAFGYFGNAYQIEVKGLQGISTVAEYGLADVTAIIDLIVSRRIKAVFVESSVPKRSIEKVVEGVRSRGHEIAIGGQLYSDAMGNAGTPEGTYIGMVSANVNTIVNALK
jgi:manganese/zinc/iron transport system substrate-binding protein